jgi:hypothetical protein
LKALHYAQAKEIDEEHNLQFNPKQFKFSSNWLLGFKKANNINRLRLRGEGESADLVYVQAVREQLLLILMDVPLEKIFNFDETCMSCAAINPICGRFARLL